MSRCYFGIENLGLNATQKSTLVEALKKLGPAYHDQPAYLCHWRIRPDNEAVIFEADFDMDSISLSAFKNRLANIFNVPVGNINHTLSNVSFSEGNTTAVLTLKYNTTNKLRVALFGGVNPTWENSHEEVLGYIQANISLWEPPTEGV